MDRHDGANVQGTIWKSRPRSRRSKTAIMSRQSQIRFCDPRVFELFLSMVCTCWMVWYTISRDNVFWHYVWSTQVLWKWSKIIGHPQIMLPFFRTTFVRTFEERFRSWRHYFCYHFYIFPKFSSRTELVIKQHMPGMVFSIEELQKRGELLLINYIQLWVSSSLSYPNLGS